MFTPRKSKARMRVMYHVVMVDVVDYVSSVEVVLRVRVRNKKEETQNNEWVYYDIK